MLGNVWELCANRNHKNYTGAPTDGSPWMTGTEKGLSLRGGSYNSVDDNCRAARRSVVPDFNCSKMVHFFSNIVIALAHGII